MATSTFHTTQYPSTTFVESCGAILFDLRDPTHKKVCLLYYLTKNEYLLAKGRRNLGETRHACALREVREETGYPARLHPVTMATRCPPAVEEAGVDTPDEARVFGECVEPFMLTVRHIEGGAKLIWWYIAAVDEGVVGETGVAPMAEAGFRSEFLGLEEAVEKLTFQNDRDVLKLAIDLVGN